MTGSPPLRIAFLDSWLRSRARGSGSAVAIDGLARGLEHLGHRVDRVGPDGQRRGGLVSRLAFNLRLAGRFDPTPYDLVVGFDLDGCFLDLEGTPRVAALKGIAADEMRFERGFTRLRFGVQARLERRSALAADRVAVTSRYCRHVAVGAYGVDPERVVIAPEGIDPGAWEPARPGEAAAPESAAHPAGVGRPTGGDGAVADGPAAPPGSGAPRILSVARQYPRKNTQTLLRAVARLRSSFPDVRLRVVGGGPRLPPLRRLAADLDLGGAVGFLGEIEDAGRVREEYRTADVFCLPSLQEGFGIVFLEAMAAGLPVVAGRAGAVPEVVPDGEAGILVPPRDVAAVADALARIAGDRELGREMGRRGREHARGYTWPRAARRFLRGIGTPPA